MNKILKGAVVTALMAGVAVPAFAQEVLVIDLDRVYAESAAGKNGQTQLQSRYQAPSQQVQTALNAASSSYQTQVAAAQKLLGPNGDPSKLPPATRTSIGQAQDRLEEARAQAGQLQQAVQASAAYVREQINGQVLGIAEQVRAEKKAQIVVVKGSLLAADPNADITSVVLPRLDAKMSTVQIVPPQPTAAPAAAAPAPVAGKPAGSGR